MKCRICNKPAELQPGEGAPLYKFTCDCSTKLPTTDEEIQAFADAGFCDFVVIDPVEPNGDGGPRCATSSSSRMAGSRGIATERSPGFERPPMNWSPGRSWKEQRSSKRSPKCCARVRER